MKKILLIALVITCEIGVFFVGTVHAEHPYAETGMNVSATVLGICGNDLVEPYEQCDGIDLNGKSCMSLGYATGTISCNDACAFDVAMCVPFPVTASSSEPVYDNNGRAMETITVYTNPHYPSSPATVESPDAGQGSTPNGSIGTPSSTSVGGGNNGSQQTPTKPSKPQKPVKPLPSPIEPITPTQLIVTTGYWIGISSLALLILNIKKILAMTLVFIARILKRDKNNNLYD